MNCKEIRIYSISELIGKRQAIEGALKHWSNCPSEYFVSLKVSYLVVPSPERTEESLLIRREVLSQYLGVECTKYWKRKGGGLGFNKEEYLELWDFLKVNQVREDYGGILKKIFSFFNKKKS